MTLGGDTGDTTDAYARSIADADLVLVGPAPPLRGGIAQHTLRLGEAAVASGLRVASVSFRRLYPAGLFPGRSQRTRAEAPTWSREMLDVLSPASWREVAGVLGTSRASVVLQWWHPVTAPAYAAALRGVPRERLVAVCHNATPHEAFPGGPAAARFVLSRCARVVCHSAVEAERVKALLGRAAGTILAVPLPCLVSEADLAARPALPELSGLPAGARIVVAAGHVRPYKGTALLLRAWRRAKRPEEARLVVVGESYLKSTRERRTVTEAGGSDESILFVDRYVEDAELVQFLRSAEVLSAAHLHASQSGIVPIARALGLACIVSDAGGLAEQVAGGDGHEVVAAADEDALCHALERRLALPRRQQAPGVGESVARARQWSRVLEAVAGGTGDPVVEANAGAARPTARPTE